MLEGCVFLEEFSQVIDVVEVAGVHVPGGVELFALLVGEADGFDAWRRYCGPGTTVMV